MALQTAVQGRARQARDRRLSSVEAIVERQQGMPSEGDDHRLFLNGQHRRLRLLRTGPFVGDRGSLAPFGHRLLVDPVALRQRLQALLTMLYRSTDSLSRRGAP